MVLGLLMLSGAFAVVDMNGAHSDSLLPAFRSVNLDKMNASSSNLLNAVKAQTNTLSVQFLGHRFTLLIQYGEQLMPHSLVFTVKKAYEKTPLHVAINDKETRQSNLKRKETQVEHKAKLFECFGALHVESLWVPKPRRFSF